MLEICVFKYIDVIVIVFIILNICYKEMDIELRSMITVIANVFTVKVFFVYSPSMNLS